MMKPEAGNGQVTRKHWTLGGSNHTQNSIQGHSHSTSQTKGKRNTTAEGRWWLFFSTEGWAYWKSTLFKINLLWVGWNIRFKLFVQPMNQGSKSKRFTQTQIVPARKGFFPGHCKSKHVPRKIRSRTSLTKYQIQTLTWDNWKHPSRHSGTWWHMPENVVLDVSAPAKQFLLVNV